MKTVKNPQTLVKIQRNDGTIETMDVHAKTGHITDAIFAQMKTATAKAGRGIVLSYENIDGQYEMDANEIEMKEIDNHQNAVKKAMSY